MGFSKSWFRIKIWFRQPSFILPSITAVNNLHIHLFLWCPRTFLVTKHFPTGHHCTLLFLITQLLSLLQLIRIPKICSFTWIKYSSLSLVPFIWEASEYGYIFHLKYPPFNRVIRNVLKNSRITFFFSYDESQVTPGKFEQSFAAAPGQLINN